MEDQFGHFPSVQLPYIPGRRLAVDLGILER